MGEYLAMLEDLRAARQAAEVLARHLDELRAILDDPRESEIVRRFLADSLGDEEDR